MQQEVLMWYLESYVLAYWFVGGAPFSFSDLGSSQHFLVGKLRFNLTAIDVLHFRFSWNKE